MASVGRARNDEKNEKLIRALSKLKENKSCINCNSLVPQYVCTNFWTFVCLTCSGIHREFTHRVKSISMSKFTAAEVAALNSGGNQRARELYLKKWDFKVNSLPDSSNVEKLRSFIKQVYVERRYAAEGLPPKNKLDDYGRFSVDSRYQEDLFDAGRFSSTSYRGGSDSIIRGPCFSTSNDDVDTSGHLSSSYRGKNSDGGSAGSMHLSNGNGQGDRMRRHSNYPVYWDQKLNQKGQSLNTKEYAGRENFSQKLGKAEIGPLNGDCKSIYKFASFSNGTPTPAEQIFPVFQRANSDSLIDFGIATDDCTLAKEMQPNLFESQGLSSANETWASSVNEGWATFDVHPPPPPVEVATLVTDPNSLVQTGYKQTSDGKTFSLQSRNGSLDTQPSYPHQLSKEVPQQQNPFSSMASVFNDSRQPGGTWEIYNNSMTSTACVDSSSSDQRQHSKESFSSFVEHQKSKNPFDIPEDYESLSSSSINFPSMDSLQMALPALALGSNSVPISLQSEWAPNEINHHQPFNSCPAAENYSSRILVSSPLQVATIGCAMQTVNSGAQFGDSITSAGGSLQLPFQSSSQCLRSNNPFD